MCLQIRRNCKCWLITFVIAFLNISFFICETVVKASIYLSHAIVNKLLNLLFHINIVNSVIYQVFVIVLLNMK